jgi:pyruvate/2-oxoacid:ferredoxin oxidoreductase alpha subunit
MGTMGNEAKITVDNLRKEGLKIGCARVRVFRSISDRGNEEAL